MASPIYDGLALWFFRAVFGRALLAWTALVYVPLLRLLERPARLVAGRMDPGHSTADVYLVAIDLYKVAMNLAVLGIYAILWSLRDEPFVGKAVAVILAIPVACRLVELVAVFGLLYFCRPDEGSRASFRPVANAFWSYVDFALVFAAIDCAVCVVVPGAIASTDGKSVMDSFGGALYFSVVTIATIGYGDFVPHGTVARLLTGGESLAGLFLMVAVVQKSIARIPQGGPPPPGSPARDEDESGGGTTR